MKIKFKKLEATGTFLKLFGKNKTKPESDVPETGAADESYEYYYKRGNTYYFRNNNGEKRTIDYTEPQTELIRGHKYKIEELSSGNN